MRFSLRVFLESADMPDVPGVGGSGGGGGGTRPAIMAKV